MNIKDIKMAQDSSKMKLDINYRIDSLKRLKESILVNEHNIYDALVKDLNKTDRETFLCEVNEVLWEIDYHVKNIKKWTKDVKVKSTIQTFGMKSKLVVKPKGKVLIISPFNYPINLLFIPLIGAISAGNRVLIKTSPLTPSTNSVIYKIIENSFLNEHVTYIDDKNLSSHDDLYKYEPNLIFFTGSTKVGKEIEKKCVENNIEYVTELGGQCPCIVNDIQNDVVYERIVWAKWLNAGQTCVSINYLLYNKNITDFKEKLISEANRQFNNVLMTKGIVKIINEPSFERITKIIDENKSNVIYGGKYDKSSLIIEPTIIEIEDHSKLGKYGEIFGPVLLISPMNQDFDKNIETINSIDNSPLAAYLYSNEQELRQEFIFGINAGSYAINDSITQILNHNLPFGGTYTSGSGKYHGKYTFNTMSFIKPVLINDLKKDNKIKYIWTNGLSLNSLKSKLNALKKMMMK